MSTPMMRQYERLKKKHEDAVLLFRLGDFYEAFDNDAKILSKVLGIVLTGRGKNENRKPMAGIPHHALDNYLPKLVNAGYKVAICEQLEEPQKGKKIVERDVVKIITSGTLTSEKVLDEGKNNYIISISELKQRSDILYGMSVSDLSTGEFYIYEFYKDLKGTNKELIDEILRMNPAELLASKSFILENKTYLKGIRLQEMADYDFDLFENKVRLQKHFKVKSLAGFGIHKYKAGIIAAGVMINYLQETQKTALRHISKIYYKQRSQYMLLDEDTIRNLELVAPLRNDSDATLLSVLNSCETPMGKRKLLNWIISPLTDTTQIENRLSAVEELINNTDKLTSIRSQLDNIFDIERILGKIGTESVNARDLLALKDSLTHAVEVADQISVLKSNILKNTSKVLTKKSVTQRLIDLITNAIEEDPPFMITEGGIIKDTYDKKLAEIKSSLSGGKEWLRELQLQEIKRTGIQSLKVRYNKVFGYYIEISKSNLSKVPENYIRKQTLVNAERYITPELKEKEDMILNAGEKAMELEYEIFVSIRGEIAKYISELQEIAESIANLDVISNFAFLALQNEYSKPQIIVNSDGILKIIDGRHPVVEKIEDEKFIPNDTLLDDDKNQVGIITGPNMAGKSTYIRQVALIVLMAQVGCFVPAKEMIFTPLDRIFTRVGASDNLAGGESTFLVEMNETANILNNARKNSLIILDEVGRGTSTYDGVAIAWAVAEYIHNEIGAKTLFATHYHELIDLEKYLPRVRNYNVAIQESKGEIVFLRKIEKGGTDRSYGVHVAQFAGIPDKIISRAKEILLSLEQEGLFEVKHVETELTSPKKQSNLQLPMLTVEQDNPIVNELSLLDVNKMTPIDALGKLNELIDKAKKK
ncbi:MAG: DNA mismatch repair protein MutS [Candidatus Dojkabacteria bacterium]|nr:DNA mismatch repair protein MutS [Candidatus Dojkabacteria bacterium]